MTTIAETASNTISHEASNGDQFLTFMLAGEEYGVDILRVQELRGWEKPTMIPNTPSYVRGVINIRGTIVPIIDLRERFALPLADYSRTTVVVVVRVESPDRSRIVGVVVDAVSDVYNLSEGDLKPAPDFGDDVQARFARAIATIDDKMIIALDIDRLLSFSEFDVTAPGQS